MAKIKGITNEIAKILTEYSNEIEVGMSLTKDDVSKKTAQNLKNTSPKKKGKGGGRYAKGWTVSDIRGKKVIHNKTYYQLTHLLEYGHAKVNGGRVDAIPHIRPAEEEAIKEFNEQIRRFLG